MCSAYAKHMLPLNIAPVYGAEPRIGAYGCRGTRALAPPSPIQSFGIPFFNLESQIQLRIHSRLVVVSLAFPVSVAPHLRPETTAARRPMTPPPPMPRHRPARSKRGYDPQWERATAHYRAAHPWCLGCMAIGLYRKTQVVDHIVPHRGDRNLFWSESNWQPCCRWHHDSIKQSLELQFRLGQCTSADLVLTSRVALKLARERHKPAIGPDGFAIEGT
jgi:5-methylcytosine-specific restriction enzyme A